MTRLTQHTDWVSLAAKWGPSWALCGYLIYVLTTSLLDDVKAMRAEHLEISFYMRATCLGVNRDQPHVCDHGR